MKDFASYSEGAQEGGAEAWMREAQAVSASMQGRSENDLLRAIYARALEGKRNGTLTNEEIDAFAAQIASMLDGAKRKKLQAVVRKLKEM